MDQYKQRHQEWLAQAHELVRLREEARLAAEREALDIITSARRDVRRIVVQARRDLLVLTAQLQNAIDAVDHATLESGAPPRLELPNGEENVDAASLGATHDAVRGTRREVRSVLDEARAEIEALVAETGGPLAQPAQRPVVASRIEPPIPTLASLLGTDPLAAEPTKLDGFHQSEGAPPLHASSAPVPPPFPPGPPTTTAHRELLTEFAFGPQASQTPSRRPLSLVVGAAAALLIAAAGWWVVGLRNVSPAVGTANSTPDASSNPAASSTSTTGPTQPAPIPSAASAQPTEAGVFVEVRRPTWLRFIVDGKEDSRIYQTGETRRIAKANVVSLRAGDAGAVVVSVNGRSALALGPDGRPSTQTFVLSPPATALAETAVAATTPAGAVSTAGAALGAGQAGPTAAATEAVAAPRASDPSLEDARPSPAQAAPGAPTPAPAPAGSSTAGNRSDLVTAGQQWLDAYHRRDRDGMAVSGTTATTVADERAAGERFPVGQAGVRRELEQVELQLTGDTALLTARMVERAVDGSAAEHVSRVSQIWVRRAGQWRLSDVRLIGESRLNQIVR